MTDIMCPELDQICTGSDCSQVKDRVCEINPDVYKEWERVSNKTKHDIIGMCICGGDVVDSVTYISITDNEGNEEPTLEPRLRCIDCDALYLSPQDLQANGGCTISKEAKVYLENIVDSYGNIILAVAQYIATCDQVDTITVDIIEDAVKAIDKMFPIKRSRKESIKPDFKSIKKIQETLEKKNNKSLWERIWGK